MGNKDTKYRIDKIRKAEKEREYNLLPCDTSFPTTNYIVGLVTGLALGSAVTFLAIFSWGVL